MARVQQDDPFDLERFLEAQRGVYEQACAELRRGRKTGHWMWFIFPQLAGLGSSAMSQRYAIRSPDEARAYLAHPILELRLQEITNIVLEIEGRTAEEIFGWPDDAKLRSSMTLFTQASDDPIFLDVLNRYFHGQPDARTLELLGLGK